MGKRKRWFVSDLTPQSLGFDPSPVCVCVGFVVDRFLSEYFGFPVSIPFHQCLIFIFTYHPPYIILAVDIIFR
jgi:hypothetical protein